MMVARWTKLDRTGCVSKSEPGKCKAHCFGIFDVVSDVCSVISSVCFAVHMTLLTAGHFANAYLLGQNGMG